MKVSEFFSKFERGDFGPQRLGQAFVNSFSLVGHEYSDLFYETDNKKALKRIWEIIAEYNYE